MNVESSTFSQNQAFLGPAISNTVSLMISGTQFDDNTLLCDDSEFLDWTNVSGGARLLVLTIYGYKYSSLRRPLAILHVVHLTEPARRLLALSVDGMSFRPRRMPRHATPARIVANIVPREMPARSSFVRQFWTTRRVMTLPVI